MNECAGALHWGVEVALSYNVHGESIHVAESRITKCFFLSLLW